MIRGLLSSLVPEVMALDAARQELDDATVELVRFIDDKTAKRAAARARYRRASQALDLAETRLNYSRSKLFGTRHLTVVM